MPSSKSTKNTVYTDRLLNLKNVWWKQLVDVQAPYRWNSKRLDLGFVFEIGCGIGRILAHINGNGVGIDHNADSVSFCRQQGLTAFTTDEFSGNEYDKPGQFDTILLAHVIEHMTMNEAIELIKKYSYLVKPGGKLVMITPQEAGFKSDATHVEFADTKQLVLIAKATGFNPIKQQSFPFPRFVGQFFRHNEFVVVGRRGV